MITLTWRDIHLAMGHARSYVLTVISYIQAYELCTFVCRWVGADSNLTASSVSVLRAESVAETATAVVVVSCEFEEDVGGAGRLKAIVNGEEAILYG